MSLQWSEFGGKVRNLTKCTILVRIWSDFGGSFRSTVGFFRFQIFEIQGKRLEYSNNIRAKKLSNPNIRDSGEKI